MICCPKDIIDILAAFTTPTIAAVVGLITFFQWRTNEKKRQNELFDRRYKFYQRLKSFYLIYSEQPRDETDLIPFCDEASFLFGDDIVRHILAIGDHDIPDEVKIGGLIDGWFVKPFMKYLKL
jgi:hypothetical protein